MKREQRYGIKSLTKDFPTEQKCLDFLFEAQHSRECGCGGRYTLKQGRKTYQCSKCRYQIAPTAYTLFHKSDTPLTLWFKAILTFSNAKSGISAKEMERQLEVTYKTAWRILHLIRKALEQEGMLSGDVEMDTAYFGGKKNAGKNNENLSGAMKAKTVVMGAVQRGGNARLMIVPDSTAKSHGDFLNKTIDPNGTRLMTDKTNRLEKVAMGFNRHAVDHGRHEYVRGDVHANTIEAFWSHLKRSITGTHKVVSRKYLQEYLNGFVFLRDNRHSDKERFWKLLSLLTNLSTA